MIITNKHNLPKAFVSLASEEYEVAPNEYRVTSLLRGVRETMLLRRHNHEIEADVADMAWLLFGAAVHSILERQQEADSELKEERLKVKVGDYILSGQFDLYCGNRKCITDYKTASVWKFIYRNFDEWRQQLLIYAWMLRQYGFQCEMGQIVAFLKDHSKQEAKRKADYPLLPVQSVKFSFSERDFQEIEAWLHERFSEIAEAEKLPDDQLPVCTPEERFNSGDKYAVMKKGRKTALRVLDSREEAEKWMAKNGKGDSIEVRPGEDKKCADYCFANEFCNYWQEQKRVQEQGQTERSA